MVRKYYIGMDVHKSETEIAVITRSGQLIRRERCKTAIPELAAVLDQIPRRRQVVIEEGQLADWLFRNLDEHVEEFVICDPRRNSLIAKDSDKSDPIDAEKLAQLYRGGYIRAVHHADSIERAHFKQRVGLYHDRVRNRVRQANRTISQFARDGVLLTERGFSTIEKRAFALQQLPTHPVAREDIVLLLRGYDSAVEQERELRRRLIRDARKCEPIRRFTALPGVKWIRAATIYAYLDTPWRFKSKSALWRYLGIGLERQTSGAGPVRIRVSRKANRCLKNAIIGAAQRGVCASGINPFADQYRRYMNAGMSHKNARRSVARSLAAVLWGMWKSGDVYQPELVGVAVAS